MSQVTDTPAATTPSPSASPGPGAAGLARMSPADIAALRQAGDPQVSPDGTTVAFTVTDADLAANRYARRIWLAPAGGAGAGGGGG
jgi:hypothetical protein